MVGRMGRTRLKGSDIEHGRWAAKARNVRGTSRPDAPLGRRPGAIDLEDRLVLTPRDPRAKDPTAHHDFRSRQIVYRPSDPNHSFTEIGKYAADSTAADSRLEAAKASDLARVDREHYRTVANFTKGNPVARRELQLLLIDGKLIRAHDSTEAAGTVLDHLHQMATGPIAKHVDRQELVSDVVGELLDPVRIDQRLKGTCAGTQAYKRLDYRNPAEYARIVAGLASPHGTVQLAGGHTLRRSSDWQDASDAGRTVSGRLVQPAVMQEGRTGTTQRYSNKLDTFRDGRGNVGGGLQDEGAAELQSQLEGRPFTARDVAQGGRKAVWKDVEGAIARGQGPIPIGLRWDEEGYHQVGVVATQGKDAIIDNGWAQLERISKKDLVSRLSCAIVPVERDDNKVGLEVAKELFQKIRM